MAGILAALLTGEDFVEFLADRQRITRKCGLLDCYDGFARPTAGLDNSAMSPILRAPLGKLGWVFGQARPLLFPVDSDNGELRHVSPTQSSEHDQSG